MNRQWWKECVVYQIYPISFKDSNGDGIGDVQGIISKLDYLQQLGVDVLWLCPIYKSPRDDNGYDISDYRDIMAEFGTMADFDQLLEDAHAHGMKIMMDLVLNHTSDEHPWFIESRSSRDNPKRDYYVWRKGKNGGPPNNWESYFSGSVWEYDEATEEYYLHLYSKRQPDLNWTNPEVVKSMHEMVQWWLEKGVDGFRLDAIAHIAKVPGLPDADNPDNRPTVQAYEMFSNLDEVHDLLRDLNQSVLTNYDLITVGETSGLGPEEALQYVGDDRNELHMVFQFEHMQLDAATGGTGKWDIISWELPQLKRIITNWQTVLHNRGWNANYISNHDQPRPVSRWADDKHYRVQSAQMLGTFVHMLEGTPYIYQGEEIGMTNIAFDSIDDYRDVETLNFYKQCLDNGMNKERIMDILHWKSRDNARTPMQWDTSPSAGFTTGEPWISLNPNYSDINVEAEIANPNSVFHYYRRLIALRKQHEVVIYGKYELLLPDDLEIYAFTRTLGNQQLLIILNFYGGAPLFQTPESLTGFHGELLISNYPVQAQEDLNGIMLHPYEARVYLREIPAQ